MAIQRRAIAMLRAMLASLAAIPMAAWAQSGPAITVNPQAAQHPISPLIYGMAEYGVAPAFQASARLGVLRWGGDGTTRYNWQVGQQQRRLRLVFHGRRRQRQPPRPAAARTPSCKPIKATKRPNPAHHPDHPLHQQQRRLVLQLPGPDLRRAAIHQPIRLPEWRHLRQQHRHRRHANCSTPTSWPTTSRTRPRSRRPGCSTWSAHSAARRTAACNSISWTTNRSAGPIRIATCSRPRRRTARSFPWASNMPRAVKQQDPSAQILGPSDFTLGGWIGTPSLQNNLFAGQYYLQQMAAYSQAA